MLADVAPYHTSTTHDHACTTHGGCGGEAIRDGWWDDQLDRSQRAMCVNALKVLKAVLATASTPGRNGESALIPANPCMIPTPGQKREIETVPATVDQVKAIHDNMPVRYADTIYIAVFCNGPRIGTICTLQRRDIDLEHLILHIRRSRKIIDPQTAMHYQHSVSGRAQDLAKRIGNLIPHPTPSKPSDNASKPTTTKSNDSRRRTGNSNSASPRSPIRTAYRRCNRRNTNALELHMIKSSPGARR